MDSFDCLRFDTKGFVILTSRQQGRSWWYDCMRRCDKEKGFEVDHQFGKQEAIEVCIRMWAELARIGGCVRDKEKWLRDNGYRVVINACPLCAYSYSVANGCDGCPYAKVYGSCGDNFYDEWRSSDNIAVRRSLAHKFLSQLYVLESQLNPRMEMARRLFDRLPDDVWAEMEARFEAGAAKYGDDYRTKDNLAEASEELVDVLNYWVLEALRVEEEGRSIAPILERILFVERNVTELLRLASAAKQDLLQS